ncbi:elongation factor P [Candidatus Microgenomates bacterium]|nr:MAG: elongation factor P [Candidatus Microgenomates bacterium]
MSKITTSDFRKGMFVEFKGEPHQIMEFQHVNPGKGSAFVRTKLKNFKTGRTQEFTYKAGESVTEIIITTREMQYLYKEGNVYQFMDNENYEQFAVPVDILSSYEGFFKENETYQLMVLDGAVVGVRFPKKVRLKVTDTEDAVKGNTVSGATKAAILETGVTVQVPLFIKNGDTIGVDPETRTYVERVSG